MTILGAVIRQDGATIWADSETLRASMPLGHGSKLSINPLAGMLVTGHGLQTMLREAMLLGNECGSLDEFERRAPRRLRDKAGKIAPALGDRTGWFTTCCVVAAGYSEVAGRFVGLLLDAGVMFEVVPVGRHAAPSNDAIEAMIWAAQSVHDLVRVARAQIDVLRANGIPDSDGGTLTLASLGPDTVSCVRVPWFYGTRAEATPEQRGKDGPAVPDRAAEPIP